MDTLIGWPISVCIGIWIGIWICLTGEKWLGNNDYESLLAVLKSQWRWIRSKRLW